MPTFDPKRWSDPKLKKADPRLNNNCYDYAVDKPSGRKTGGTFSRPGRKADQKAGTKNKELKASPYTCAQIQKAVELDGFTPSTKGAKCPKNCWKVAVMRVELILQGKKRTDFHFVRQDDDGTWSHKQDYLAPTQKDSNGKKITDPDKAVIRAAGATYTVCGYYCVCPTVTVAMLLPPPDSQQELVDTFAFAETATLASTSFTLSLEPGVYTLLKEVAMDTPSKPGATVTAHLFSGEANPAWELGSREIQRLSKLLAALAPLKKAPDFTPVLRGFSVTSTDHRLPALIEARDGVVRAVDEQGKAHWYKDSEGLEDWLEKLAGAQPFGDLVLEVRRLQQDPPSR